MGDPASQVYSFLQRTNKPYSETAMAEVAGGKRGQIRLPSTCDDRTTAEPRFGAASVVEGSAPAPPAPSIGLMQALRGLRYDLRHFDKLPGRTRLQRAAYAATRDGRGWYLAGVGISMLIVFVVLFLLGRMCGGAVPRPPYYAF